MTRYDSSATYAVTARAEFLQVSQEYSREISSAMKFSAKLMYCIMT